MMHTKCEAVSQITFDEDLNVPDIKPDVGRMIQKKGEIHIDDVQISEGHAFLTGALMVYLLYVSDSEERKIQSLLGTLPIGETMHLEGLENGDKVRVKWDIEDLSVQKAEHQSPGHLYRIRGGNAGDRLARRCGCGGHFPEKKGHLRHGDRGA